MANSEWLRERCSSKKFSEVRIADNPKRFAKKSSQSFGKVLCGCKRQKISPDSHRDWERNPLSIDLWTKEVLIQKMEYIHNNPVTAGLCTYPEAYKNFLAKFYESGDDEFGFLTHWIV